jgi:RNA polymerase sigma-70 factor (TIGR02943 family)
MRNGKQNKLDPSQWVGSHADYLFNYCLRRIYSREIAEDLVQETFLAAYKAKDTFKGNSTERTWLVSILKRKIVDHYRHKAVRKEEPAENFELPFYQSGNKQGKWKPEKRPQNWETEDRTLEQEEFYKILEFCLSLLPEKWKSTFSLKIFEEISTDQVCKELNISKSNLWVILHRSRLKIRECLEKNWFDKDERS